ncbi:transcription factor GTE3, chloroplastic-like [Selaginella moellendorffii]|uniref:transcription factor GTE3, chloroplastic-like n=1 Tax=Selaginella moellendorffii TaxID=88036 RepID=UPI000D1D115E|nr:transcription factor GTE3, chloroplastic-like [Selaginella moellendorffii]|eukprot:XP_024537274.1 transcription factor GTE3, chloroplastic-like [Selaginella moellendorffii]
MSPSSQLTAATANGTAAAVRPEKKQQLEADLATIEQLIARIARLEDLAAARNSSGSSRSQQEEIVAEERPQQQGQQAEEQHPWDEGSGERQSSSHGGEDTVGARMTVASSSSDIRAAGHKRGEGEATGPAMAKKPKLSEEEDPVSEGSLSRRVGGDAADNGSNHTMSTLHSSEETSSQRRDDYELHKDAWDKALRVLEDLRNYSKEGWVFCQPVQSLWPELVDYTKVIEKPMDLGTVKSRVQSKYYSSPKGFARDVRLTFDNAIRFNAAGSMYHKLALKMRQKFETAFKAVERLYNRPPKPAAKSKIRPLVEVAPPPPRQKIEMVEQKPVVAPVVEVIDVKQPEVLEVKEQVATPVSRARDLEFPAPKAKKVKLMGTNPRLGRQANSLAYGGCRLLSAKEKAKLSELVDSFPEDRMRKVIEIVGEKHPELVGAPEVELDLDKLDKNTLFNLYRLAMNWQKSKNKVLAKSKSSLTAEDSLSDGQQRMLMDNSDNIDIVGLDSPERENGGEEEGEEAGEKKTDGGGDKETSSDSDSETGTSSSSSESSGSSSDSELDSEGEAEAGSDKDKG